MNKNELKARIERLRDNAKKRSVEYDKLYEINKSKHTLANAEYQAGATMALERVLELLELLKED